MPRGHSANKAHQEYGGTPLIQPAGDPMQRLAASLEETCGESIDYGTSERHELEELRQRVDELTRASNALVALLLGHEQILSPPCKPTTIWTPDDPLDWRELTGGD